MYKLHIIQCLYQHSLNYCSTQSRVSHMNKRLIVADFAMMLGHIITGERHNHVFKYRIQPCCYVSTFVYVLKLTQC